MAGSAHQRRPGVWELRAYGGRDPLTGRKRYPTRTVQARTKREAQRLADAFALEVAAAGPTSRRDLTVGEVLEKWYAATSPEWSPGTAYQCRWRIDYLLAGLHDRPVGQLTALDLDEFYAALRARGGRKGAPLAATTVRRAHGDLRGALDQAVKWGLIASNPAHQANPGRSRRTRIRPPSADTVRKILTAAEAKDPELLTYLFLDAETGARRGEIAALRVNNFGADSVTIARALVIGPANEENARTWAGHYWPATVKRGERPTALIEKDPKTEESIRTISLAPPTLALVAGQATRISNRVALTGRPYPLDGFLFPAPGDGTRPLRPDTWSRRFGRLRDDLGLELRLHDLRHFVATAMLAAGIDVATAAGRLGHGGGGKTTLAIYSHFLAEPDRVASDVMAALLLRAPAPTSGNVVPIRRDA